MSLAVPYIFFVGLVTATDLVWGHFDGIVSLPLDPLWMFLARLAFGGSALKEAQGVAWFAPCLFFVTCGYAIAARYFSKPVSVLAIAIVALALAVSSILPPIPTPLGIGQAPYMFVFFWVGAAFAGRRVPTWLILPAMAVYAAGV